MSINNNIWISATASSSFTTTDSVSKYYNYNYNYHSYFEKEIGKLEKERETIKMNEFACNLKDFDDLPEPKSIKKEEPQTILYFDPATIFDK